MTEMDFALSQKQETEIIELVGTILWNKANRVNEFTQLSQPEQTFIYIDIFESELIHGGLFDFFYNTSGAYAHEIIEAYDVIGAHESANLVAQAINEFPEIPVPKDIFHRRSYMTQLTASSKSKWADLEDFFFNSNEDIMALLIDYIKIHKTAFEY